MNLKDIIKEYGFKNITNFVKRSEYHPESLKRMIDYQKHSRIRMICRGVLISETYEQFDIGVIDVSTLERTLEQYGFELSDYLELVEMTDYNLRKMYLQNFKRFEVLLVGALDRVHGERKAVADLLCGYVEQEPVHCVESVDCSEFESYEDYFGGISL